MLQPTFYIPGNQPVQIALGKALKSNGYNISPLPCPEVTHLLLPVPSFLDNGELRCGGDLDKLISDLSPNITLIGGKFPDSMSNKHTTVDLLNDPEYIAQNAYITACCALRIILMELPLILRGCKILIIGWGRIAQCLASLLRSNEADITIAARKPADRALAAALGYKTIDLTHLEKVLAQYRVICNTAPANVITAEQIALCNENCLKIDLASKKGIDSKHVIWARGLPGKDAPESSGRLIADTVIRLINKEDNV